MKHFKKAFKLLLKTLIGFVAFLLIYVLLVFIFSIIPINSADNNDSKEIEIYILTNGVHTDIVVPIKNDIKDWSREISYLHTKKKDSTMSHLAFGWGDRGFYLDTPTWADLKVSTALKATTGLSSSAMHVTFYKSLREDESCKKMKISAENYKKLMQYISASFLLDKQSKIQRIGNHSYGVSDVFYEAKGSYNLFYTCNSWANGALKAANQKAALWTVLDKGIFWHYE
ncbi:TIGR02117 family protein [Flavobacterium sp.]|jgi:uncharacterized protein (TIGR02117 family)|uniref:TIGR02117 family protein n=1 Tax=Flavobacterium sp. TaxID=239 RepID=UPI002A7FE6EC|nr:TIGR02117 family protein [Flavobacterium sp.]